MKLTLEDIEHIATLARLALTDEEKFKYQTQLTDILDYADQLEQVKANKVPFSHQSGLINALREDVVEESLRRNEALKNAPIKDKGFVKVKAVL